MTTLTKPFNLVGDELLIAVFNQFPKDQDLNFKDEANIMHAFYKASRDGKYDDLFKNYHFDEDGIEPYSKEIADGINILHQTSLMGKWNPSFSLYRLTKGIDIRFETFIAPKLIPKQKELIQQLSKEIEKELK